MSQLAYANAPLLTLIAEEGVDGMRVAEVARRLGRDPDNTRKTVKALAGEGFLQDGSSKSSYAITEQARQFLIGLDVAEGRVGSSPQHTPGQAAPAASPDAVSLRADQIVASPLNPRTRFDAAAIGELAGSIANALGEGRPAVLQALMVRQPNADGRHAIIGGERRWRAVGQLITDGLWPPDQPLPCRVFDVDDATHARMAVAENLHRVDLNPIDLARQLKAWADAGMSQDRIAELCGKTTRFVQLKLDLLNLPAMSQIAIRDGAMTAEEGRRILAEQRAQAAAEKPPAEVKLTSKATMALVELADRINHHPDSNEGLGWSAIRDGTSNDRIAGELVRHGLIMIQHDRTMTASLTRRGWDWLGDRNLKPVGANRENALFNGRAIALGDGAADKMRGAVIGGFGVLEHMTRYATEWLNPPFSPTAFRSAPGLATGEPGGSGGEADEGGCAEASDEASDSDSLALDATRAICDDVAAALDPNGEITPRLRLILVEIAHKTQADQATSAKGWLGARIHGHWSDLNVRAVQERGLAQFDVEGPGKGWLAGLTEKGWAATPQSTAPLQWRHLFDAWLDAGVDEPTAERLLEAQQYATPWLHAAKTAAARPAPRPDPVDLRQAHGEADEHLPGLQPTPEEAEAIAERRRRAAYAEADARALDALAAAAAQQMETDRGRDSAPEASSAATAYQAMRELAEGRAALACGLIARVLAREGAMGCAPVLQSAAAAYIADQITELLPSPAEAEAA